MKNKFLIILSAVLVLSSLMCACEDVEMRVHEDTVTTAQSNLPMPDANLSFADNLMKMTEEDGNRMISPYSAKMCLALLANGANGQTKAQILDAIGVKDINTYNEDTKALLERYATYAGVMSLETANSLWINQSVFGNKGAFLEPYYTSMQNYFGAEVREVTNENSVEEVNAWVNNKTKEKIPSVLKEEHRNFATALVNAVYFKAGWMNEFEEHLTKEQDFNNADGTVSKIDFMHNTAFYPYCEIDGVKAIKIDYGRWGGESFVDDEKYSFSMYILLGDNINVEEFLNNATFSSERIALSVPKFKFEYSFGLNDILKALGVVDAFDKDNADFSNMVDLSLLEGNLIVSDVLQKTYIGIDEKGTEASAVTAIIMNTTGAFIEKEPRKFTADVPFYFAIRDNTSGELLFIGRYETAK